MRSLTFLELSIDRTERAASIIRRHSCAWQAVSDSQARSSGSSSRPSGVIRRSPRKEKPAQGPVKSIRWCGSNSIMPRSHPWPGTEDAGKSRARGPAIAMPRTQTPPQPGTAFRIMYIMFNAGLPPRQAEPSQPSDPNPLPVSPCPLNPHNDDSQTESKGSSHHLPDRKCSPSAQRHHAGTRCDSGNHAADSRTPPSLRHGRQ